VLPLRVAEMFVRLLPNAEGPVAIEGASHFLQEDKPDEVAAAINGFLAR
jgi:pimeloyl-ACP methyl ester carboxylesterase